MAEHIAQTRKSRYWNMAEALVMAGVAIFFACLFDYRYATNDDSFIQAVISGRYSGEPSVHNIQIIVVLNALFVLLYQISGAVPWFGIFMVSAQFFSLYLILSCVGKKLEMTGLWRHILIVAANLLMAGLMLRELVILQYTYTAALLAVSAALRLYCAEEESLVPRKRLWRYGSVLAQYLLAFCLRTEICLFLLPFAAAFMMIRFHKENGFRNGLGREGRQTLRRSGIIVGSLTACILLLYAADALGYSAQGWKEYRKVFDSRTQLYDFLALPDYGGNWDFYESAGITESQYALLKNYNFALDDTITSDTLASVVYYVNDKRTAEYEGVEKLYMRMFTLPLREGLWSYGHRLLFDPKVAQDDYPWNFVCAGLYLILILLTFFTKRLQNFAYMALLFAMRSVLWMYIILKQRTPPRVVHPLFAVEIACLLLLVFEELSLAERMKHLRKPAWLCPAVAVLFLAGGGAIAVAAGGKLAGEYGNIVEYNEEWRELTAYCAQHEENFYFMDVYSTVNYTEKIFDGSYGKVWNYDICGGWLAKSPLSAEKYEKLGFSSPREALVGRENVFFVAQRGSDLGWLIDLYAEKGSEIELEYRDAVAGQFDIIKLNATAQP